MSGGILEVVIGDITTVDTEAIVNAANTGLWMGSGVAGAIKRAGGEEIEREAVSKGPIRVGEAVATGAGRLPYKAVIHAAAMGYQGGRMIPPTAESIQARRGPRSRSPTSSKSSRWPFRRWAPASAASIWLRQRP